MDADGRRFLFVCLAWLAVRVLSAVTRLAVAASSRESRPEIRCWSYEPLDAEPVARAHPGWRLQFRFAVHAGWPRMPEFWTLGLASTLWITKCHVQVAVREFHAGIFSLSRPFTIVAGTVVRCFGRTGQVLSSSSLLSSYGSCLSRCTSSRHISHSR